MQCNNYGTLTSAYTVSEPVNHHTIAVTLAVFLRDFMRHFCSILSSTISKATHPFLWIVGWWCDTHIPFNSVLRLTTTCRSPRSTIGSSLAVRGPNYTALRCRRPPRFLYHAAMTPWRWWRLWEQRRAWTRPAIRYRSSPMSR